MIEAELFHELSQSLPGGYCPFPFVTALSAFLLLPSNPDSAFLVSLSGDLPMSAVMSRPDLAVMRVLEREVALRVGSARAGLA
eukprot:1710212-Rhodomonas_salina.1